MSAEYVTGREGYGKESIGVGKGRCRAGGCGVGASGGVACGGPPDAEVNSHPTAPTPTLHDSSTFRLPF